MSPGIGCKSPSRALGTYSRCELMLGAMLMHLSLAVLASLKLVWGTPFLSCCHTPIAVLTYLEIQPAGEHALPPVGWEAANASLFRIKIERGCVF